MIFAFFTSSSTQSIKISFLLHLLVDQYPILIPGHRSICCLPPSSTHRSICRPTSSSHWSICLFVSTHRSISRFSIPSRRIDRYSFLVIEKIAQNFIGRNRVSIYCLVALLVFVAKQARKILILMFQGFPFVFSKHCYNLPCNLKIPPVAQKGESLSTSHSRSCSCWNRVGIIEFE